MITGALGDSACAPGRLPAAAATAQLAARWQVSTDYVYGLIKGGMLRTLPVPPGTRRPTYRVPADAVAVYEAGETATSATPAKRNFRRVY